MHHGRKKEREFLVPMFESFKHNPQMIDEVVEKIKAKLDMTPFKSDKLSFLTAMLTMGSFGEPTLQERIADVLARFINARFEVTFQNQPPVQIPFRKLMGTAFLKSLCKANIGVPQLRKRLGFFQQLHERRVLKNIDDLLFKYVSIFDSAKIEIAVPRIYELVKFEKEFGQGWQRPKSKRTHQIKAQWNSSYLLLSESVEQLLADNPGNQTWQEIGQFLRLQQVDIKPSTSKHQTPQLSSSPEIARPVSKPLKTPKFRRSKELLGYVAQLVQRFKADPNQAESLALELKGRIISQPKKQFRYFVSDFLSKIIEVTTADETLPLLNMLMVMFNLRNTNNNYCFQTAIIDWVRLLTPCCQTVEEALSSSKLLWYIGKFSLHQLVPFQVFHNHAAKFFVAGINCYPAAMMIYSALCCVNEILNKDLRPEDKSLLSSLLEHAPRLKHAIAKNPELVPPAEKDEIMRFLQRFDTEDNGPLPKKQKVTEKIVDLPQIINTPICSDCSGDDKDFFINLNVDVNFTAVSLRNLLMFQPADEFTQMVDTILDKMYQQMNNSDASVLAAANICMALEKVTNNLGKTFLAELQDSCSKTVDLIYRSEFEEAFSKMQQEIGITASPEAATSAGDKRLLRIKCFSCPRLIWKLFGLGCLSTDFFVSFLKNCFLTKNEEVYQGLLELLSGNGRPIAENTQNNDQKQFDDLFDFLHQLGVFTGKLKAIVDEIFLLKSMNWPVLNQQEKSAQILRMRLSTLTPKLLAEKPEEFSAVVENIRSFLSTYPSNIGLTFYDVLLQKLTELTVLQTSLPSNPLPHLSFRNEC